MVPCSQAGGGQSRIMCDSIGTNPRLERSHLCTSIKGAFVSFVVIFPITTHSITHDQISSVYLCLCVSVVKSPRLTAVIRASCQTLPSTKPSCEPSDPCGSSF